MKNLTVIFIFSLIISLSGCGNKSLIYQGASSEVKKHNIIYGSKKYEKQKKLRAQHNARRAAKL